MTPAVTHSQPEPAGQRVPTGFSSPNRRRSAGGKARSGRVGSEIRRLVTPFRAARSSIQALRTSRAACPVCGQALKGSPLELYAPLNLPPNLPRVVGRTSGLGVSGSPRRGEGAQEQLECEARVARDGLNGEITRDFTKGATGPRLLAVVLLRLQRAKPPWASVTGVQIDKLLASWLVFVQDPLLSRPELDMRLEEALEQLEAQSPCGMKARRRPADLPRGRRHKKSSRK